jgi:hypothetical protein
VALLGGLAVVAALVGRRARALESCSPPNTAVLILEGVTEDGQGVLGDGTPASGPYAARVTLSVEGDVLRISATPIGTDAGVWTEDYRETNTP